MYGVIIGAVVAVIVIVMLLVCVVFPPSISLNSLSVDKGTAVNVNSFFFWPGQQVTVGIVRASDNQPIAHYDYTANTIGILSFKLGTDTFDAGKYKVVINSSRGEIAQSFEILGGGH